MQLVSGRFLFRPFEPSDVSEFVAAVRESASTVGKWMPWATVNYSNAEAESWFEKCQQERAVGLSHEFGIFEAESKALVGGCGLNQFNQVNGLCNLGYWVRESWQRKGAALAAIRALSAYGFAELGLGRIEIVVAEGNLASLAVAVKAGATQECLARNRLKVHGSYTNAYVCSLVPQAGV
jgi:RimJ/RimL family protein N-acetyltransferase